MADGRVKVLDFGLARLEPGSPPGPASTATRLDTAAGVVLGTVGYMSPEQVRGGASITAPTLLRRRALQCWRVRPFRGDSAVETMNAILTLDPPPLTVGDASLAPAVAALVEHCLEKEPAGRFQSAQDLAFNLEALRGRSDRASGQTTAPVGGPSRRRRALVPLIAVGATMLVVGAVVGARWWQGAGGAVPLTFLRLTYETGTLWNARFAPDGQNVVFAAAWNGNPIRTYLSRTDRVGVTPLILPDASLFSMSATGELAVSLGHAFDGWMGEGRWPGRHLAGAPGLVEHVREATGRRRLGSGDRPARRLDGTARVSGRHRALPDPRLHFTYPLLARRPAHRVCRSSALQRRQRRRGGGRSQGQEDHAVAWPPGPSRGGLVARRSRGVVYGRLRPTVLGGGVAGVDARRAPQNRAGLPTDWRILDVAKDGRALMSSELVQRQIEVWRDGRRSRRT